LPRITAHTTSSSVMGTPDFEMSVAELDVRRVRLLLVPVASVQESRVIREPLRPRLAQAGSDGVRSFLTYQAAATKHQVIAPRRPFT
jgi:hypothetical protein